MMPKQSKDMEEIDIRLSLPDESLQITWSFKKGMTWQAITNKFIYKITGDYGEANMCVKLAKSVRDLAPTNFWEMQQLLMAMRKSFTAKEAIFTSNTVPDNLDEDLVRAIVLLMLDSNITIGLLETCQDLGPDFLSEQLKNQ